VEGRSPDSGQASMQKTCIRHCAHSCEETYTHERTTHAHTCECERHPAALAARAKGTDDFTSGRNRGGRSICYTRARTTHKHNNIIRKKMHKHKTQVFSGKIRPHTLLNSCGTNSERSVLSGRNGAVPSVQWVARSSGPMLNARCFSVPEGGGW